MNAAEHSPESRKVGSCLSSSFSFPSSLPPASAPRNHSEEMTDHIWKMHASNCLVAVEVRSQLSSQMGKGWGGKIKKIDSQILPYFSLLIFHLLIICSKKACGLSWKICQQYNISPSSALYFLCLLSSGSCFPPMETLKPKKSASLIAWAHNKDSKALKLWPSCLIPCSGRTEGKYIYTPSRHEAPCQIYSSENFLQEENDTLSGG